MDPCFSTQKDEVKKRTSLSLDHLYLPFSSKFQKRGLPVLLSVSFTRRVSDETRLCSDLKVLHEYRDSTLIKKKFMCPEFTCQNSRKPVCIYAHTGCEVGYDSCKGSEA